VYQVVVVDKLDYCANLNNLKVRRCSFAPCETHIEKRLAVQVDPVELTLKVPGGAG
jgi:hypothetical protein